MTTKKNLNELKSIVRETIEEFDNLEGAIESAVRYGKQAQKELYDEEEAELNRKIEIRDKEHGTNYRHDNNNAYRGWLESISNEAEDFGYSTALEKFEEIMGRPANDDEKDMIHGEFPNTKAW